MAQAHPNLDWQTQKRYVFDNYHELGIKLKIVLLCGKSTQEEVGQPTYSIFH